MGLLLSLAVFSTGVTACSTSQDSSHVPRPRLAGADTAQSFGLNIVAPPRAADLSVGAMNLCVDTGTVTASGAAFEDGSIPVKAFGVRTLRADQGGLGYLPGSIRDNGFPASSSAITITCAASASPEAQRAELGITVTASKADVLHARNLIVTYESSGGPGRASLPLELARLPRYRPFLVRTDPLADLMAPA